MKICNLWATTPSRHLEKETIKRRRLASIILEVGTDGDILLTDARSLLSVVPAGSPSLWWTKETTAMRVNPRSTVFRPLSASVVGTQTMAQRRKDTINGWLSVFHILYDYLWKSLGSWQPSSLSSAKIWETKGRSIIQDSVHRWSTGLQKTMDLRLNAYNSRQRWEISPQGDRKPFLG